MKLTYLTLFVLITLGFVSCRKDKNDIGIKEYDEQQITAYIKANGLTNMKTLPGDTSGIYYEILTPGNPDSAFTYSDDIKYVFSFKTLDGSLNVSDTIANHVYIYAGQITPPGLQMAMNTMVKNKGTRARVIVPSRLAYGVNGSGVGTNRVKGNQSLEYYINVISDQDRYDDKSIQNYMTANGLTGFTKTASGIYFKERKAGTGTTVINSSSSVTVTYRGKLLNNYVFDPANYSETNSANTGSFDLSSGIAEGFKEALLLSKVEGADVTVIMPSRLAYGNAAGSATIPAFSCLYFDISVGAVTNP